MLKNLEIIGFEFNKFLLYFYIFKSYKELQALPLVDQVNCLTELYKRIGIEALDFYYNNREPGYCT